MGFIEKGKKVVYSDQKEGAEEKFVISEVYDVFGDKVLVATQNEKEPLQWLPKENISKFEHDDGTKIHAVPLIPGSKVDNMMIAEINHNHPQRSNKVAVVGEQSNWAKEELGEENENGILMELDNVVKLMNLEAQLAKEKRLEELEYRKYGSLIDVTEDYSSFFNESDADQGSTGTKRQEGPADFSNVERTDRHVGYFTGAKERIDRLLREEKAASAPSVM